MKKLGVVLMALLTLGAASIAQADCHFHHCDDEGAANLFTLEVFLGGLSTTTLAGHPDENAAYLQNVQDDAANYLAGGEESAVLQEAIQSLRDANQVNGSDSQVAALLVGANN